MRWLPPVILSLFLLGCPPTPAGTAGTITMVERRFSIPASTQYAYITVKYDNGVIWTYGPYDATILQSGFFKAGQRVVGGNGLWLETSQIESQLDPTKAEKQ